VVSRDMYIYIYTYIHTYIVHRFSDPLPRWTGYRTRHNHDTNSIQTQIQIKLDCKKYNRVNSKQFLTTPNKKVTWPRVSLPHTQTLHA
jgi:hypothetical protein